MTKHVLQRSKSRSQKYFWIEVIPKCNTIKMIVKIPGRKELLADFLSTVQQVLEWHHSSKDISSRLFPLFHLHQPRIGKEETVWISQTSPINKCETYKVREAAATTGYIYTTETCLFFVQKCGSLTLIQSALEMNMWTDILIEANLENHQITLFDATMTSTIFDFQHWTFPQRMSVVSRFHDFLRVRLRKEYEIGIGPTYDTLVEYYLNHGLSVVEIIPQAPVSRYSDKK